MEREAVHDFKGNIICTIVYGGNYYLLSDDFDLEEWAWRTALRISKIYWGILGGHMVITESKKTVDVMAQRQDYITSCLICQKNTILPHSTAGMWNTHYMIEGNYCKGVVEVYKFIPQGFNGYFCYSDKCPVQGMVIPNVLIDKIDKIPSKYK